jgi:hypothetical protein
MTVHTESCGRYSMQDRSAVEKATLESLLEDARELRERAEDVLRKSAETLKFAKATLRTMRSTVPSSRVA